MKPHIGRMDIRISPGRGGLLVRMGVPSLIGRIKACWVLLRDGYWKFSIPDEVIVAALANEDDA